MDKTKISKKIKTLLKKLEKQKLPTKEFIIHILSSWWKLILSAFVLILFLYYPVGAMLSEDIDTNLDVEITPKHPEQSMSIEMMAFLIDREVNQKSWTPNLPFIFPSYVLDNMPNFQLGIMSSVRCLAQAFAQKLEQNISEETGRHLQKAAKLLQYPGNVWMFSPQNKLTPAPSSSSQYRRARKNLVKYSQSLADGTFVFYRHHDDLAYFLTKFENLLKKSSEQIEVQIREHSSDLIDNKADDIFYHGKGQIYGMYLLLKAMTEDYKEILVKKDVYLEWTQMLNALETGSQLSPAVVRNGELESTYSPNHLVVLDLYATKARTFMHEISNKIRQ